MTNFKAHALALHPSTDSSLQDIQLLGLGGSFSVQEKNSTEALCLDIESNLRSVTNKVLMQFELQQSSLEAFNLKQSLANSISLIRKGLQPLYLHSNLNSKLRKELTQLRKLNDVVFRETDKNLGLCAIGNSWYKNEVTRQVTNPHMYQSITKERHHELMSSLRTDLLGFKPRLKYWKPAFKSLFRKLEDADTAALYFLPKFYVIPKIHKDPVVGRPIVPNNQGVLALISGFAHECLFPLTVGSPTIANNTMEVIREAEKISWPNNESSPNHRIELITADISDMYNNIKLDMVRNVWNKCLVSKLSPLFNQIELSFIFACVSALFTHSCFTALDTIYIQTIGIAMGTLAAPTITNLTIFGLELFILEKLSNVLSLELIIFKRYLDDFFLCGPSNILKPLFVWITKMVTGTNGVCNYYGLETPSIGPIKHESSFISCNFLDVNIFKRVELDGRVHLCTRLYRKHINAFQHLPFFSAVPRFQLGGIITGECIRILRSSSLASHFREDCQIFKLQLLARGYPSPFIDNYMKKITFKQRLYYLNRPKSFKNISNSCSSRFLRVKYFDGVEKALKIGFQVWNLGVKYATNHSINYSLTYNNGGIKLLPLLQKKREKFLFKYNINQY